MTTIFLIKKLSSFQGSNNLINPIRHLDLTTLKINFETQPIVSELMWGSQINNFILNRNPIMLLGLKKVIVLSLCKLSLIIQVKRGKEIDIGN